MPESGQEADVIKLPTAATEGHLFAKAKYVERLPFVESTEQAHLAAWQALIGRSGRLVAVWDGKPARRIGGTADIVGYACQKDSRRRVVARGRYMGVGARSGERTTVEGTYHTLEGLMPALWRD